MWQLLLAAAVAGSTGLAAKHFLSLRNTQQTPQCNDHKASSVDTANLMLLNSSHESVIQTNSDTPHGLFIISRNSSKSLRQDESPSKPEKQAMCRPGSKNRIRIAKAQVLSEHRNGGKRMPLYFKRRKTVKSIAAKPAFCSSKASILFGWGVSFGIMRMMPGKAEINELSKTMDKTIKVVEELKSELNRRKSPCAHQILDYVGNGNTGMESGKMSCRDDKRMLKNRECEVRDTDIRFWSLPVNDNGECGSSALTEESDPLVLEMDQLEAELEFELQKLPGHTIIDPNFHEEIRPKLYEVKVPNEGCDGTENWDFNSSQYHGVSASELNQKLCQLLIEQQETQITDLESELNLAQSKLREKEAELQALKNCLRLLPGIPPSTVSGMIVSILDPFSLKPVMAMPFFPDDETEAHKGTSDWDFNTVDLESKHLVGGVKRPIDSESCAYYPINDSDIYDTDIDTDIDKSKTVML
ncbi:hypothetical protein VNO77_17597 [Canavalia gladiata]|uniref:Uncharacterized protein n=1 Tax=Canavalia gladiata TaxID=3824 RepID=A0AAN9QIV1_CANGL